jgi:hypothetical protein
MTIADPQSQNGVGVQDSCMGDISAGGSFGAAFR